MISQCTSPKKANDLGVIYAFSEVVKSGVKPLALSEPMTSKEIDKLLIEAEAIANKHGVGLFREPNLIQTDLFPASASEDKEVLLIHNHNSLSMYLALKKDQKKLIDSGNYDYQAKLDIARRFGRILGYSPTGINHLLALNTSFRTLKDFGIESTNLFLYYKNLNEAAEFYTELLGLYMIADYGFAKILQVSAESFITLVDEKQGMHQADDPKSVAIALLTEQLDEWNEYLTKQSITFKYPFRPKAGGAHDGFVIEDPEGYLLEFERFKQHPENETFMPILDENKNQKCPQHPDRKTPEGLGFHSSITWVYYDDLLRMEQFMAEVLGLDRYVDQGWAKVYQVSNTGFIGLVDGRRGMCTVSEEKGATLSFFMDDLAGWFEYVNKYHLFPLRDTELNNDPEGRYQAFVGFDPGGYYLEFDVFLNHPLNKQLNSTLDSPNGLSQ